MGRLGPLLPDHLLAKTILVQGGCFRMSYQFGKGERKLRYFFVLNRNPQSDETLYIVTSTSQVASQRHRPDVVVLTKEDYASFSAPESAINLGQMRSMRREVLLSKLRGSTISPMPALKGAGLERLLDAVREAKTVERRVKEIILGPDRA